MAAKRFISEGDLAKRLARARLVLLGEKHDNPHHHLVQAWAIRSLTSGGRRPAVAWEMITASEEDALKAHLSRTPKDAAGLGPALTWKERGWPKWSIYLPVAQAAMASGLPLAAAGLDRKTLMKAAHGPANSASKLPPLPPGAVEQLGEEIRRSHCGHAGKEMVRIMTMMQRRRDDHIARRLAAAAQGKDGAVLIAGNGHVRRDYAVPFYLLHSGAFAADQVLTLGARGVRRGETDPSAYADGDRPFDYLWFTERIDNEDPCTKFREQLKRMGEHKK